MVREKHEFELKAQNITAQQYILINRYTVNRGNVVENMHYLMAALSYEVDLLGRRKAWDYNYEAKAQTFLKQMPYDIANTIMVLQSLRSVVGSYKGLFAQADDGGDTGK